MRVIDIRELPQAAERIAEAVDNIAQDGARSLALIYHQEVSAIMPRKTGLAAFSVMIGSPEPRVPDYPPGNWPKPPPGKGAVELPLKANKPFQDIWVTAHAAKPPSLFPYTPKVDQRHNFSGRGQAAVMRRGPRVIEEAVTWEVRQLA